MKKTYRKPNFQIETFALAQSVAAGCGAVAGGSTLGKPNHWSKSDCGWDLGNGVIFLETDTTVCDFFVEEDMQFEGICYNNPDGGSAIYGSY